jgi:hypothetical protein
MLRPLADIVPTVAAAKQEIGKNWDHLNSGILPGSSRLLRHLWRVDCPFPAAAGHLSWSVGADHLDTGDHFSDPIAGDFDPKTNKSLVEVTRILTLFVGRPVGAASQRAPCYSEHDVLLFVSFEVAERTLAGRPVAHPRQTGTGPPRHRRATPCSPAAVPRPRAARRRTPRQGW